MEFEKIYSVSDVAQELDVSSNSIRNWCSEFGFTVPRDDKGHRYFDDSLLQLLKTVKEGRTQGHGLTVIKKALVKNNMIEGQKENALDTFPLGNLDKSEIKEMFGVIVSELIAEKEELLLEEIRKDIKEEFAKSEEQRSLENKKLLETIEKLRGNQKLPWWGKIFK